MKAVFFKEHGSIDVLQYGEVQDAKLVKDDTALVKVRAVALNRLDIWVREGWEGLMLSMPHITGSDIAGEVVEVKGRYSDFKKGDEVVVFPGYTVGEDRFTREGEESLSPHYKIIGEDCWGGLAQYVVVPLRSLIRKPSWLSWEESAASLLVGVTCWRMLFKRAKVKPYHTVLVVGAGGGVNSLSIQLCKAIGCRVVALAGGEEKEKKALELGADEAINYKKELRWHNLVLKLTKGEGADIVIDNVGAATFSQSIKSAARGGVIVTVGNTSGWKLEIDNRYIFVKQLSIVGSTMGSKQDLINFLSFQEQHKIKPVIDKVFQLKDGIEAVRYLEEGKNFGKVVLKVN
ncbi:MAG: alcohol dehydrogenase [Candidatus Dadabacteria bacterium]|nr:MAG: alcohol dehydrogenase [Candidatus Dadabacteria bacterium]